MTFHNTSTGISKKTDSPNDREGVKHPEPSFTAAGFVRWDSHFAKALRSFFKSSTSNSVNLLVDIYQRKTKTYVHKKPCTRMFMEVES